MKVIYYYRQEKKPFSKHQQGSHMFYVPDENIILTMIQDELFAKTDYGISSDPVHLAEAKSISEGHLPDIPGKSFSDIKDFSFDETEVHEMIKNALIKHSAEQKLQTGMKRLLNMTGIKSGDQKPVIKDIDEACIKIYDKLDKKGLDLDSGTFIVMEMKSEEIFTGSNLIDVIRDAEKKHPRPYPHRVLHGIQIGFDGCFLIEFEDSNN